MTLVKADMLSEHYTTSDTRSGMTSGTTSGMMTTSQWGTHPPPIASIFVKERNYVFCFTSDSKISYLRGSDGNAAYSDTTVVDGNDLAINVTASTALLAATAYQNAEGEPMSIRVYYTTGTCNEIQELVGDFEGTTTDTIKWSSGEFTGCKYKASSRSGLTASSSKNGTLRVFFMSEDNPTHISEAYIGEKSNKWQLKTLV